MAADGVLPQIGTPRDTFRSGRGFGGPAKDTGVER